MKEIGRTFGIGKFGDGTRTAIRKLGQIIIPFSISLHPKRRILDTSRFLAAKCVRNGHIFAFLSFPPYFSFQRVGKHAISFRGSDDPPFSVFMFFRVVCLSLGTIFPGKLPDYSGPHILGHNCSRPKIGSHPPFPVQPPRKSPREIRRPEKKGAGQEMDLLKAPDP